LICGGATGYTSTSPASPNCARIIPPQGNPNQPATPTWVYETMPLPRVMADMIILPDERIFISNGAQTGWNGFDGKVTNPALTSVIYDPNLPSGNRMTADAVTTIPRLYHSESLLLEDGRVLISGSNPNSNANVIKPNTGNFRDEKQLEYYYPSYLADISERVAITSIPVTNWTYGQSYVINTNLTVAGNVKIKAFTNGFVTHSVHMVLHIIDYKIGSKTSSVRFYFSWWSIDCYICSKCKYLASWMVYYLRGTKWRSICW
jgi:hypothetical protein